MTFSKGSILLLTLLPILAGAQVTGPTSSQSPYALPSAPGWKTTSLITVGDGAEENGYRMVGIPDGLGALAGKFENGRYVAEKSYMTVFMNHELPSTLGVVRAHGATGAFVSQWTVHLNSLQVRRGEDLIEDVFLWNAATGQHNLASTPNPFNRLCSADLPAEGAFYNRRSGKGFRGRLFMDGEEVSDGRGFAHVVTGSEKGNSYELAHLGRFAYENTLAHPNTGDKTVLVSLDDSTPGQIYVYLGTKKRSGNPVERAGLVGGSLFGIRVTNGGSNYANGPVARENNGPITTGAFNLVNVSDVAVGPAATLDAASNARGVTNFARPEDGHWDTKNSRVFYFVVTGAVIDGQPQSARLYKLTFNSVTNPTGGTIQLVVDRANLSPSTPTFPQFDNMTVAADGSVLVQEDTGNNPYLARTWRISSSGAAQEVLISDPARFSPPNPPPFNQDEENSGIIEVTDLVKSAKWFQKGRRYFLADTQAHYANGPELVEGGQFYLVSSAREFGRDDDDDDDDEDDD